MKTIQVFPKLRYAVLPLLLLAQATTPAIGRSDSEGGDAPPPIPGAADVLLVGNPQVNGQDLAGREATLAMGRSDKSGPLALGATIQAGALQTTRVERISENGREILRRSTMVSRPDSDDVLMQASIDMDAATLLPLVARMIQKGQETVMEYDWEKFVLRTSGAASSEIALDLPMFEVGAHDIWMAALPLRDGFVGRLPAVFAATGTKYWAVPRVVGSEAIDLGDGTPLQAWVVELDWWGMGADNTAENHSLGGGANNTGGPGGKYWVLKNPPSGVLPVVRVRTEVDAETDSVIQIQGGR